MEESNLTKIAVDRLKSILFNRNSDLQFINDELLIVEEQLRLQLNRCKSNENNQIQESIFIYQSFEISIIRNILLNILRQTSPTVIRLLLDIVRSHVNMSLALNPIMADYYFHLSLTWLSDESILSYLDTVPTETDESFVDYHIFTLLCNISIDSIGKLADTYISLSVSRKKISNLFDLGDNTDRLFRSIINYFNRLFLLGESQIEHCTLILNWLLRMTNIYIYIPNFIKANYAQVIVEWMKIEEARITDIDPEIWLLVIRIAYNLGRHWVGSKALNKSKAIDALKSWKVKFFSNIDATAENQINHDILAGYYLTNIILLESKEIKNESMIRIQKILDHLIDECLIALKSNSSFCGLYHLSEYLTCLAKLVANDQFLIYFMKKDGVFNLLLKKFINLNELCANTEDPQIGNLTAVICSSLYTIFWSISFQHEFSLILKENEVFTNIVKRMETMSVDNEHYVTMKRAAKGILFNLDLIEIDLDHSMQATSVTQDQVKVMISYAHKDTKLCQKILTDLQGRVQGEVWVDFMKLKPPYEDDWEEIARAITQSDVILMIVTENYCASKSCRREVIHADKRGKRLVPIYFGKEYKPEDWFEIRVGSATFVRFCESKSEEKVLHNLVELIHANGKRSVTEEPIQLQQITVDKTEEKVNNAKPTQSSTDERSVKMGTNNVEAVTKRTLLPCKSVIEWTPEEIRDFLQLPSGVLCFSSGRAIELYRSLVVDPDCLRDEYEKLSKNCHITRDQFANMIDSIINLHSLCKIQETSKYPISEWTRNEIKYWFMENQISDILLNVVYLRDGNDLLLYAELSNQSSFILIDEYTRLKYRIDTEYGTPNSFSLDHYVQFIHALKKLLDRKFVSSRPTDKLLPSCSIS